MDNTRILFIIHGLTGGSNTGYIKELVFKAQKLNYRVGVFQNRGINRTYLRTPHMAGDDLNDIY